MKQAALILFACILAFASCNRGETMYNSQESRIDSYVQSLLKADTTRRVITRNGSNRVILKHGEGEQLEENDSLTFEFAGYEFSSSLVKSNLFTTNKKEAAAESGWATGDSLRYVPMKTTLSDAGFISGLSNGLTGVKKGEECYILFSGKYAYGKRPMSIIPAYSALIFHIWVIDVKKK